MRKAFVQFCAGLLMAPVLTAILIGTIALAAGPGGGTSSSTSSTPTTPPVIRIQINATETGSLPIGKTRTLTAAVTVDGSSVTSGVTWSSSDESVAKVDKDSGIVTAVKTGEATITATYTHNDTAKTTEKATYYIKVTYASVTDLALAIDSSSPDTVSVGGSSIIKVNVTPTWSSSKNQPFTDGELNNLSWSAEIVSGSEYISLPYRSGSGIPQVRVDGRAPTPTNTKAKIEIKVTYKNVGTGVAPVTESIPCEITVGSSTQVIITEYSVQTREVTLIKGGSAKTLQAYRTENNQWVGIDGITWEGPSDETIVKLTPSSADDGKITVTPVDKGKVTLTAYYHKGQADQAISTVTCIVREETGSTDPGGTPPTDPPDGDELPDGVTAQVTITAPTAETSGTHVVDPGTENIELSVTFKKGNAETTGSFEWSSRNGGFAVYIDEGDNNKRYVVPITWRSSNDKAVKVNTVVSGSTGRYVLSAIQAGESTLTASVAGASAELKVTVRGFELLKDKITLIENKTQSLLEGDDPILKAHGGASTGNLSAWSDNSTVAGYSNGRVAAYSPGKTTFTLSDSKLGFRASFEVEVIADPDATIEYGTLYTQTQKVLHFSELLSSFRRQAGGSLSHITGLNVDAGKGTLYYKYNETTSTGTGVGSGSYYHPYRRGGVPTGQASIEDLVFVPKPGFAGEVTVYYTGVSEGDDNGESQNYACKLVINVDPGSGSNAGISLNTDYNTPVRLSGDDFSRVCRERLGTKLNYVVFSQPPERQGKLYTNYSAAGNYGSVVDTAKQYTLKELDDIWFVPAPGYSGPVTVYYTAYGTGSSGSYSGQVSITVGREGGVSIGGLAYDVAKGGVAHFDDEDFNDYCREILYEQNRYDQQTLSFIRFDSLPSASEGVLYYDYRSSVNTGIRAVAGTSYYYGTRTPRIDRLSFVPAADFVGTIKIPFTGWTADGTSFGGNVEINVRSGTGVGDIYYTCAPGRTISFRSSDFTSLSNQLTGRTVDYIVLERLPSSADGSLYYGTSRITSTGTQYRNSNIGRLSFRASSTFSGPVDIPFEGRSAGGVTFHGIVTIGTSGSGGGGSSRSSIRYNVDYGSTAVFSRVDFDGLSQWETDRNVSSVRFTPPFSSEGSLYRNYRSGSNMGTKITSTTTVNASDLDRVAFVPASGFNGTAYIDFTATASGNGGSFTGSVEVMVGRDYGSGSRYFSDMGGYSATQQAAVDFLYERNITRGLTTGQYGPENSIRRGDFARMIYQAFAFAPAGVNQAFVDVPAGVYYAEAVNALYSRGVVSGIGGGYYAPDSTLTRQDAICMVQRAMRVTGRPAGDGSPSVLYSYSDGGSVAGYAQGAMAFAVQQGYLPLNGGWLDPNRALTRVDMAEILYRVLTS